MTSIEPDLQTWPRPAVSVMVFSENSVLLGQRSKPPLQGIWSLPGGRIEPGESVTTAAERELLEETGIRADLVGYAGTRDVIHRDHTGALSVHYVLTVLVGLWRAGEAVAGSDCQAVLWAPVDELASHHLTDGTADLIRKTYTTRFTATVPLVEPQ